MDKKYQRLIEVINFLYMVMMGTACTRLTTNWDIIPRIVAFIIIGPVTAYTVTTMTPEVKHG